MLIALAANRKPALAQDGDSAFWRVDTRTPAHELQAGTAADAVNCRMEDGRVWPRFGVSQQAWGQTNLNLIPNGSTYEGGGGSESSSYSLTVRIGTIYKIVWGAKEEFASIGDADYNNPRRYDYNIGGGDNAAVIFYPLWWQQRHTCNRASVCRKSVAQCLRLWPFQRPGDRV